MLQEPRKEREKGREYTLKTKRVRKCARREV